MVLVDTTVWIDLFVGRQSPPVDALEVLIHDQDDLCVCGVILTEVLQGIRRERQYRTIRERFDSLVFLPMSQGTFVRAAEIYRLLRRKGITVRRSTDCMIAAVATEHEVLLLHNDCDFVPIEKHCGLKTVVLHTG